jgi:hypothetical protein
MDPMGNRPGSVPENGGPRLTGRGYWDAVHQGTAPAEEPLAEVRRSGWRRALSGAIRRCGGESYGQDWFWNRLLPKFVERRAARSVIEIGVAPGDEVLRFRERFA